jgi:hypothetical protein
MKRFFLLFIIFISSYNYCKVINIKDLGAIGDGVFDNSKIFNSIFKNIKNSESYKILIPEGTFLISNSIELPSNVSIEGIDPQISALKVNTNNSAIIIKDNKNDNTYQYKYIRNLSILGPEYNKNPFSWKNTNQKNSENSVGINILGTRNRIENCEIDGFLHAGILLTASYYNFINNCFIKNNKYGVKLTNTCTSTYLTNSELRFNSIATLIENSYSIYLSSNIIEANFSNFISDTDPSNTLSNGKAVVLINSNNNYIEKNYFEAQYYNIVLDKSDTNIINSNFFALADNMPENVKKKNQVILVFKNNSSSNIIKDNNVLNSNPQVQKTEMIFDNSNFSTNNLDFNAEINSSLKRNWQNDNKKPIIKN